MAFPTHYLLQFGGDLREDIWSCSIRFSEPAVPLADLDAEAQETLADDMGDDIAAWMVAPGSGWSNVAKLRYVKFNKINTLGRYDDPTVTHARYYDQAPFPSGATASPHCNQIACVISWRTEAERGRASRGRIYLPVPAMGLIAETGRFFAGQDTNRPENVAIQAGIFLSNLNNQPGLDTPGVVASVISRVDGTQRPITGVRVGNVPDTMRSRRNALDELYVAAPVP